MSNELFCIHIIIIPALSRLEWHTAGICQTHLDSLTSALVYGHESPTEFASRPIMYFSSMQLMKKNTEIKKGPKARKADLHQSPLIINYI